MTGDALKNGAYGVSGWFVRNTSLLARERFRQFRDNVRKDIPRWNENFTLLLLSEAVMVPREHMPGVKALEIPFNTILKLNPELLGNRRLTLGQRTLGMRLTEWGVDAEQDEQIRTRLKTQSNGTYEEPTVVGGKFSGSGGTRA